MSSKTGFQASKRIFKPTSRRPKTFRIVWRSPESNFPYPMDSQYSYGGPNLTQTRYDRLIFPLSSAFTSKRLVEDPNQPILLPPTLTPTLTGLPRTVAPSPLTINLPVRYHDDMEPLSEYEFNDLCVCVCM